MKVYFACAITGGRDFEPVYKALTAALIAEGHHIPTAHLAQSNVMQLEGVVNPEDVFERDVAWLREADALIAEVSVPSHGVGYEVGFALEAHKPVLCLYHQGRKISKMISGNPDANLRVRSYQDSREAVRLATNFLDQLN